MASKTRTVNKLTRNFIHENLAVRGARALTRILSPEEYHRALVEKLQEEVREFLETPNSEELADILEVVYALAPLIAGSKENLEKVRLAKKKIRGGFDKKIFTIQIYEK